MMGKPGRVSCLVPGCMRTRAHRPDVIDIGGVDVDLAEEFICQEHWGRIPALYRRVYSRTKRRLRKFPSFDRFSASQRVWKRIKALSNNPDRIEDFVEQMGWGEGQ